MVTARPANRAFTANSFDFVSVVSIALEKSLPLPLDRPAIGAGTLHSIFSIGRGLPIIPVEATRTSSLPSPRVWATRSAIDDASLSPARPLAQFALPELTMIARCVLFLRLTLLTFMGE